MTDLITSSTHPRAKINLDESPQISPLPSPRGLSDVPDQISRSKENPILSLLNIHSENERISKESIASCGLEMLEGQKEMDKLRRQQLEVLREKADKLSKADYWLDLSSVLSHIRDASTLALAVNTGGATAPLIIAAAGLNLSKPLIDLCGGWDYMASFLTEDRNNEKWISDTLKTTASYASLAASLLSSSSLPNDQQIATKLQEVFQRATSLLQGITSGISHLHQSSVSHAQEVLEKITNLERKEYLETIVVLSSEMKKQQQEETEIYDVMKGLVLAQNRI